MTKTTILIVSAALAVLVAGMLFAAPEKPKTVIHVITVQWKAGASAADIEKAIKGVETMNYPGLK